MNKHQTRYEKDKKSYATLVKKLGGCPKFAGSKLTDKEKKIMKAYDKWSKS